MLIGLNMGIFTLFIVKFCDPKQIKFQTFAGEYVCDNKIDCQMWNEI